jgi:hypothetical protein
MRLKALALMPRRPDLTRGQFRDYYETRHTPLALRYFRFRKYVRNHLMTAPDIGFDCISEFWPRDLAKTYALMQGEVGERMREDERQFTDQPRIVSSPCTEILLAGAPRADDATGVVKLALLMRTTLDAATLAATLEAWARARTAPARTVTLDSLIDVPHPVFPYDAIVWLHAVTGDHDPELPVGMELVGRVVTRTEETSAAVLARAGSERID